MTRHRRPRGRNLLPTLALLLLLPAAMSACGQKKTSDRDLVFVDPSDALPLIQERRKLLGLGGEAQGAWLDARSDREFEKGHIPGALSVPLERARDRLGELKRYDVVIVYGEGYNSSDALALSKTLVELDLPDVRTLRGGLRAWESAGFELETGPERAARTVPAP
jgi:rhodanese-related sulfurtransferase